MATSTMKTPDIITRLRAHHAMSEGKWATTVEFMRVDFLAVGTWPSTGYAVHGYEIKASRSDWLAELKNPAKSAHGLAMVDHWWLAAPAGVVRDLAELPPQWGYLLVDELGTRVERRAPRLRQPTDPNMVARAAFAMMARRVAYAEADRDALTVAAQVLDTGPALDAAALVTGRWTKSARVSKAEWNKRVRAAGASRRKKRPKQTYVGW